MIRKLLVANRGEIAIRIIRACRDLGIKTVAVYSDIDENSPHTKAADEARHIGPSFPAKSYLNIESILQAVEQSGADAVHPGYGFLAENASFAEAAISSGAVWVGPPPDVMSKIESKSYCRQTATEIGVPSVPGSTAPVESVDEIRQCFVDFGCPLLLKLDRGGGGMGIEVIEDNEQLEAVYDKARRMGSFAFGSPSCYVEKLIESPRHIEAQFMVDNYGNCCFLGERECSIQRRHQKLIEEAPAPGVSESERETIAKWTLALAEAMGYRNAGTMEFLRAGNGDFYFMEINARLQVEHGVTELVTGVDIVQNQMRIASGGKLAIRQEDVNITGHSIEARVYAENPVTFMPSPGTVKNLLLPETGAHIRVDHALEEGIQVSPYYDPLITKVMAWDESRTQAIERMKKALAQFNVEGVETTIPTSQRIFESREYLDAELSTGFIDGLAG